MKFVEKGTCQQKGGYEYRTEHKTRSASNTGRTNDGVPEERLPSGVPKKKIDWMIFEKNLLWGTVLKFSL